MNVQEWWDLQDSGRKKWIMIGGGIAALMLILWMVPGKEKKEAPDTISEVQVDILGDDQGAGDLSQLAAEMKVMKAEREQMMRTQQQQARRLQNLQNSLAAATNIADNPEQLGALVDELNRLKEDLQEMKETGYQGQGTVGTAPPVQLVLGGEDDGSSAGTNSGQGPQDISNPFSNVTDDDAGPIASYDPLLTVKGAIEDGAIGGSNGNDSRFNFMRDSNFERPPPQIVIEEPEQRGSVAQRTGGSRPGQTSRDLRGEQLDVEEQPQIYLPSGSLFEGVLLNGMDAPTSSGSAREPYPAQIRLTSLAFLPNRFRTNLRECFVGAAGFGRMDSERVHLRTETLSCVLKDGSIIDVGIEGYITGEDGKVGLRGTVVERTGALLMRAALAGLGSGLAQALEPRQVQSVRTGDSAGGLQFEAPPIDEVLEVGVYKGASTAMEKLADYYLDRVDQVFPIIEIDAMRTVTIHLTKGVSLQTLDGSKFGTLAQNESTR
jgi:conjugal transfer pilus assembly protein TraB